LFDVVAAERILEGRRPIGGVCLGHTWICRVKDIILTSRNSFLNHSILR
jgi:anthranilate/para-aminobenzoate synthase component II